MCPEALLPPEVTSLAWLFSQDGTATRNKAGKRLCRRLYLLLLCTHMYTWYEPMIHYVTDYVIHVCAQAGIGRFCSEYPTAGKRKDPNGSCLPHSQTLPPTDNLCLPCHGHMMARSGWWQWQQLLPVFSSLILVQRPKSSSGRTH